MLKDCIAGFECKVVNAMDTGASTFFLGEVVEAVIEGGDLTPRAGSIQNSVLKIPAHAMLPGERAARSECWPVIWKPSEKTPLSAAAVMALARRALNRFGDAPDGLLELVQGGRETGEALVGWP